MNTFPCKDCLIRACCSEYCDKLEQSEKIIDMYISQNQCPDCGERFELQSGINSSTMICKSCIKAFAIASVLKSKIELTDLKIMPILRTSNMKSFGRSSSSSVSSSSSELIISPNEPKPTKKLITDLTTPPTYFPPTMEETHDVFYKRIRDMRKTKYIIRRCDHKTREKIMKKSIQKEKSKLHFKEPKWAKSYDDIDSIYERKDSTEIIN